MSEPITKDIVVLYHADCPDGFGAAWSAWKKFGNQAEYVPQAYEIPFPREITSKKVYLLDFTHVVSEMEWLKANNHSVTSIDHHKSKEEDSKISTNRVFDLTHSGAVLAWKFFHPDTAVPVLVDYLEDGDLWLFRKPECGAILRYISTQGFDFQVWDRIARDLQDDSKRMEIVSQGNLILRFEDKIYDELERDAYPVLFEGREILVANVPHWFASHLGNRLYEKKPPMSITWRETKDNIHISLRSNGSVDVSEIATKYSPGSGGHRGSAGIRLPLGTPLPWKRVLDK